MTPEPPGRCLLLRSLGHPQMRTKFISPEPPIHSFVPPPISTTSFPRKPYNRKINRTDVHPAHSIKIIPSRARVPNPLRCHAQPRPQPRPPSQNPLKRG